jgi:hypothetical protein
MPLIKIETNQSLDDSAIQSLLKKTSEFAAEMLKKPEEYIMVNLSLDNAMMFAGTTGPLAYVTVKSIGLPKERCADYSSAICGFLEKELSIPADRVYVDFADIQGKMFGWNRKTF